MVEDQDENLEAYERPDLSIEKEFGIMHTAIYSGKYSQRSRLC